MIGNLLVDRARCLGRQPPPLTASEVGASRVHLDLTGGASAATNGPMAAADRAERLGWIRLGLEFLPSEDRQLIRARTFEELDFAAAGARFGLSVDAARMRLQRAMLRLAGVVQRLQRGEIEGLLREEWEV
jgi:DNA-directed RNA polymerase specialized sigma24 family protein